VRAWTLLAGGQPATEESAAALDFARRAGDPQTLCPSLALHARALVAAGDREAAGAALDELFELCERCGFVASYWTVDLALALRALGRGDELARLVSTSRLPTPWLEAASHLAADEFDAAAAVFAELEAAPEEALSRRLATAQPARA
jgi:hypothetical protein